MRYNSILVFVDSDHIKLRDVLISRDEFFNDYITKNLTSTELQKKYNISGGIRNKILQYFNIVKPSTKRYENRQKTNLERYGNSCVMNNPTIRDKIKKNNLKKYGTEWAIGSNIVQNKIKTIFQEKYGIDSVGKSDTFQEKAHNIIHEKYGVNAPAQKDISHYDIWSDHDLLLQKLTDEKSPYTIYQLCDFFNVWDTSIGRKLYKEKLDHLVLFNYPRSHYEDELAEWLKNDLHITNIVKNDKKQLEGLEIDLYLPDYKIGIEFDGDYWHSDLQEKFQDHNGRSIVHQQKSLLAESKNIFLFHIFEHEWSEDFTSVNLKFQNSKENIKNRLSSLLSQHNNRIPARKCKVVIVDDIQKQKDFLNTNHIQGYASSHIALGLEYNNKLVSCMTFVPSKYKKYNWELNRFCTIHNTVVQGGASKLFKYFVDHYLKDHEKVVSYNDITKTRGDIYKTLGFVNTNISSPNYWWVNFKTNNIRSRYQEQAGGEVERMHSQGYHRVCDCGTKTWVYTK